HHGFPAARVRVRERPAVRHVRAGDVLEAHHGARRVHGARRRHARGGRAPRAVPSRWRLGGRQGWVLGRRNDVPERAGADLLDRDRRLDDVLRGHDHRVARHPTAPAGGAAGPRVRPDAQTRRHGGQLVPAPCHARGGRAGGDRDLERGVLLMSLDVRLPIGGFFTLLGLLLTGYGWATLGAPGTAPAGVPIDLVWGAVLLVFGVALLGLARRARKPSKVRLHK